LVWHSLTEEEPSEKIMLLFCFPKYVSEKNIFIPVSDIGHLVNDDINIQYRRKGLVFDFRQVSAVGS